MRLRELISAFRTPLILLVGGVFLFVFNETLIPSLALFSHYFGLHKTVRSIFIARPIHLLYLPNVVTFLAGLIGIFALLEAKRILLSYNRTLRQDLVTALVCLGMALVPLLLSTYAPVGPYYQLLISAIQVMLLWLFMLFNGNLYLFNRYLASRPWFLRALDWTFPVSDIVFYMFHRQRLGGAVWAVRFLPSLSYVLVIVLMLAVEGRILWGAIRAEKLDIPVLSSIWAEYVGGGFWFSNTDRWHSQSGIWYYDEESRVARPYIRILDPHKFYLEDGFFYFYDRFDSELLKVDVKTRQVIWRVPTKRSDTYVLAARENLIFAVGSAGYILVTDKDGVVLAERQFPCGTTWPQALRGGRVAFTCGYPQLQIWNSGLTAGDVIQFPLSDGVIEFGRDDPMTAITTWTDYDDNSNTLYVATIWGEIFRYDFNHGKWLSSLKTRTRLRSFAVDSRNGLLFASDFFQGYIEVIELESGKHVRYIIGNTLGRYINLDPVRMTGILNTRGRGMYRFDYAGIVKARFP